MFSVLAAICAVCAIPSEIDPQATKLLDLTRTTTATYSLYSWNKVTPADRPAFQAFSTEFHQGHMHRVETVVARIVADCAKMAGTALMLDTNKILRGEQIAKAACGVSTATPILASKVVGPIKTSFGPATRVVVRDSYSLRSYDISTEGVLIKSTIASLSDEPEVVNVPIAIERKLPEPDIFSEASLVRVVTPAEYRKTAFSNAGATRNR